MTQIPSLLLLFGVQSNKCMTFLAPNSQTNIQLIVYFLHSRIETKIIQLDKIQNKTQILYGFKKRTLAHKYIYTQNAQYAKFITYIS